nr:P14 [Red mite associated cystovirus]
MLKRFKSGPTKLSHATVSRRGLEREQLEDVLFAGFGDLASEFFNPRGWKLAAAHLQLELSLCDTTTTWSQDEKILFIRMSRASGTRIKGEQIRCVFTA